jgi:hypothetical protein
MLERQNGPYHHCQYFVGLHWQVAGNTTPINTYMLAIMHYCWN